MTQFFIILSLLFSPAITLSFTKTLQIASKITYHNRVKKLLEPEYRQKMPLESLFYHVPALIFAKKIITAQSIQNLDTSIITSKNPNKTAYQALGLYTDKNQKPSPVIFSILCNDKKMCYHVGCNEYDKKKADFFMKKYYAPYYWQLIEKNLHSPANFIIKKTSRKLDRDISYFAEENPFSITLKLSVERNNNITTRDFTLLKRR
ncbi:MAG TPA: hypothetical protein VEK38_00520 [Candidatus Bathyarchaeia archaeon]|nr:hypothetical protein [Candidatus Bathyarchaeia archaeon]